MSSEHGSPRVSNEERNKILEVALKRMIMIGGNVFGLEDNTEPDAFVDCAARVALCKASCCKYVFALTQEEARKGLYRYNPKRPYYIAKDEDGYCPYLNRVTFECGIHEIRPVRCRKYACADAAGKV